MMAVLVLGLAAGAALAAAGYALSPSRVPLADALAALHQPAQPKRATGQAGLARAARLIGLHRLEGPTLSADLALLGRDDTWYLSWALTLALGGAGLGPTVGLLGWAAGMALPAALPVLASAVAAPAAVAAHVISVRADAARRRADFSFALSCYLDLVVVSMASGRGVEGALTVAAEAGSGRAFHQIRRALSAARLRGLAPWDALDELGQTLGVEELRGLAASIRLAGASGARVRASVAARARALRVRSLADARAAADSATERMSIPVVILVAGFLILIAYPAVMQVSTQL